MIEKIEQTDTLLRIIGYLLQSCGHIGHPVGAENQTDKRKPLPEGRSHLLGHAPANSHETPRIGFPIVLETTEQTVDLLLGLFPNAAGVDDETFGLSLGHGFPAKGLEIIGQPVGITDIHLAAKGDDVKFHEIYLRF